MGLKDMLKSAAASEMEDAIKESKAPAAKKEEKKAPAKTEKKEVKKAVEKTPEKKPIDAKKTEVKEKNLVQEIPIIKTVKQEETKQDVQKPKKMGRPSYEDLGMGDKRRINKSITFDEEIYNRAYQAGKKRRISVSLFIEDAIVKYLDELGE